MCGIAGMATTGGPVDEQRLRQMARALRHRGPDGYGLALDPGVGLVSTRLAIVDIPGGWQPLEPGPAGELLVYNGEIYNHVELRERLQAEREAFTTTSDTEVLAKLLARDGLGCLERLNGQFAFAWWEPERRRLTLVRDRFGVRPLHYSLLDDGTLVFGSEAKALFASGLVRAEPDLEGLDDVFTTWGPRPPRTAFAGVRQLGAGGVLVWEDGSIVGERRWWTPALGSTGEPAGDLAELLRDSVRLRLRADVPVGAYLSGGLDSSLLSALAQERVAGSLRTFSVTFKDARYDERSEQLRVAEALGTAHHVVEVGSAEIAEAFPDAIRHAETPLIRTAPVPLMLLAREVRAHGITVVVTGEGADELFWGYDLLKEVALRELHAEDPERALRLVDQLYPYLGPSAARRGPAWRRFVLESGSPDDPVASHLTRAEATATVKAFYSTEARERLAEADSLAQLRGEMPAGFGELTALERAAWLEVVTLLEPYLLAAQGDRVAMAHGVEGRFPFLDHRVYEHAVALPRERKLDGLEDKIVLRELAADLLPDGIADRPKQPYRAPEVTPFFDDGSPEWVEELLGPAALAETGLWDPQRVDGLLRRCRSGRAGGIREGMALVGILSAQIWHREFCAEGAGGYPPETSEPQVRLVREHPRSSKAAA
jgi:asparagine synthase (glutamine-hydrolysing)